jgi:23S rRNA (cytosine1962-C5)-methyltransferase
MKKIELKHGKSAPFRGRHPWLFSGAIGRERGFPTAGDIVSVCDEKGVFIAWGLYNPHSQIRVRLYSWDEDERLDAGFWQEKVAQAIRLRRNIMNLQMTDNHACRLINSEGDGLSGLTVDKYGGYLAVQFTSLALYLHSEAIISCLVAQLSPLGIILRTEQDMLKEEGLELKDGLLWGELPAAPVLIQEQEVTFCVNLSTGQKTGFYLDQRANRSLLNSYAAGKKVLDICTYTGGFALHAAKAGASEVLAADVSPSALELAERNRAQNKLANLSFIKADMFRLLESFHAENRFFDLIILDPPKMTHARSSVQNALNGYHRLNALAMQVLNPGGILFTCSCSGRISRNDFFETIQSASVAAKRFLQIIDVRGADKDHPVAVTCLETEYLKCVICRVQ